MDDCVLSENSTCSLYEENYANDSNLNDSVASWPSCSDAGMLFSAYFQAAIYLTYGAIFVLALLGNGLVCYVVLSSARMRTVTNLFIANMAVGDIMMTVLCVPFSFVSTLILQYWPFGAPLCHTVSFSQAVSVLVSAYTLVAISVDRYMAIMWPLRPRMGKRHAKVVILLVWVVALATALPIPLVTRLYEPSPWHTTCQRSVCNEHWDSNLARVVYGVTLLVLQYAIPFLVLVFTYTSIAVVVWGKRPPGEAENARDMRIARSKRKMVKMMITIVVVFTTCWLPFNILLVVWSHDESLGEWEGLPYMWFAFHWLAMSHTCYNPIIYCWMNTRFRAGFCTVLGRVVPGEMRMLQSTAMTENSVIPRVHTVSGSRYLHSSNCVDSTNKIVKFHEDMI